MLVAVARPSLIETQISARAIQFQALSQLSDLIFFVFFSLHYRLSIYHLNHPNQGHRLKGMVVKVFIFIQILFKIAMYPHDN